MTESNWTLDTPDGFKIYGVLNTSDKKKNNKAILHIHGLARDAYDYASTRMAQTFTKYGYDVIRPSLYSWEDDARTLKDATIKLHAQDIDLMVKHFKKKYTNIYATGHSYGGPSLMSSNINQFSAVSLWDATYIPQKYTSKKDFIKVKDLYIYKNGWNYALGEDLIEEALLFDKAYARSLSKKCKAPIQVIYGGKDPYWFNEGESFHTHAKGPTSEHVVNTSQHFFYEEGSTEPLLRYTRKWFDSF